MWRSISYKAVFFFFIAAMFSCDFRITQDKDNYDDLSPEEKTVVQLALEVITGFNNEVEKRTDYSISHIIDKEKINVSFDGNIIVTNLGDGVIHIAPWENLSTKQHELAMGWFGASNLSAAEATYKKFFYEFLVVSQAAKEYMYTTLSVEWVYGNRSIFNVERDTIRETLSYYRAIGKESEYWTFATNACSKMLATYRGKITFNKTYLLENLQEIANPKDPTKYIYYICEWIDMGKTDAVDLTTELLWVIDIPSQI